MDKLLNGAVKLGINLSPDQMDRFSVYYRELVDWNRRINLTAITDFEEVQIKHFLDSLTVSLVLDLDAVKIIDVGTGAGFPGIPLKIWRPEMDLTLLEATGKKAGFLRHIVSLLGLKGVEIVVGRAEDLGRDHTYREKFDVALSRGVAPMATLVELTLPFCKVGGRFIAQKKGDIDTEIADSEKAVKELGGRLREIKKVDLPEFEIPRWLVIVEKVAPTPEKYPRRPGMPAKRPIGGGRFLANPRQQL